MRRRPYSVVLLDEIEKAHPDVANILLQIMEDGALTDSEGRRVDFTHTLVILTSNLGAKHLAGQRAALGFGTGAPGEGARAEVMREVREHFSPELLGRLDEVLVFGPLAQEDLVAIGETLLRELEARAAQQGIRLAHTPAAARLLVREAYEPSSGARSLRRAITRRVEQCLAQQLLGGVENGAAADFLLDAPQDVLSLARRCGTAANAAQGGARGGGEADAPNKTRRPRPRTRYRRAICEMRQMREWKSGRPKAFRFWLYFTPGLSVLTQEAIARKQKFLRMASSGTLAGQNHGPPLGVLA